MDAADGFGDGTINPQSVYVAGRYVFLASNSDLRVFDAINPNALAAVGTLSLSGGKSISVSGRYAYITRISGQNLLSVVDVTGLETTSANIHSLEAGNLQVRNSILVGGQLQVGDSLNVGFGGILKDRRDISHERVLVEDEIIRKLL